METYIIVILQIVMIGIQLFWKGFLSKKGENVALMEDSRDISYETKKGENLATKEDIEELTQKIETIKTDISFENQRKHDFINERTKRLLNILFLTEELNNYHRILLFSLYETNSSERLNTLIEQINMTLLNFVHECRIAWITINDKDLNTIISALIKAAQEYANYMCGIARNGVNQMNAWTQISKVRIENNNSELFNNEKETQDRIARIRAEFEMNIKEKEKSLYSIQIKYLAKLNILFDRDFHINKIA